MGQDGGAFPDDFQADIDTVQRIPALPAMLNAVCRATGMGFAAIARVTDDRWVACGVDDHLDLGLTPGTQLQVDTTICGETRKNFRPIIIEHVAEDPVFCSHPTPALYRFQSYISVPILLPDGTFFGTLCAVDSKPHRLATPQIANMFTLFAELIAYHIDVIKRLDDAIDRFGSHAATLAKPAIDIAADHLLLARSAAAPAGHAPLQRAIDLALYLCGKMPPRRGSRQD